MTFIIERILLLKRRGNFSNDWLMKLPRMARAIEKLLFHGAESFSAYSDLKTLPGRMREIASRLAPK